MRRGLAQKAVGEMADWDQAKVSRMETGQTAPLLQDLADLSRILGVPAQRLYRAWDRAA